MTCCRCKEREGKIIHSKSLRADGSYYILKYYNPCQAARVLRQLHNKKELKELRELRGPIKEYKYTEALARESYLRLSKKYAKCR